MTKRAVSRTTPRESILSPEALASITGGGERPSLLRKPDLDGDTDGLKSERVQ